MDPWQNMTDKDNHPWDWFQSTMDLFWNTETGWWFQIFVIFTPNLGKCSNLTNIFQMGWFNHQLGNHKAFEGKPVDLGDYSKSWRPCGALLHSCGSQPTLRWRRGHPRVDVSNVSRENALIFAHVWWMEWWKAKTFRESPTFGRLTVCNGIYS